MTADTPAGRPRRGLWARVRAGDLGSYRSRAIIATGVLGLLAALALIAVVQISFSGNALEQADRVLAARSDLVVGSIDAATPGDTLTVPSDELGPGVAVYDASGHLVAGEVSPALAEHFATLARSTSTQTQQLGSRAEMLATPFTTASGASGVVVAAERLAPYQDQEWDAIAVAIVAGFLIVLASTGLVAWATKRALAPVAEMARTAEDWSEHALQRRFDLGPPTNEIRALGRTLDALLDRVAQVIEAEQRLTSELAHELRSPLTAIQATAELAAMRDDLDPALREDMNDIQASSRAMADTVAGLLELARTQAAFDTSSSCRLGDALSVVLAETDPRHHTTITHSEAADVQVAAPLGLVVRAISPVVENAVRVADLVSIRTEVTDHQVSVEIADDGPGIDPAIAPHLFEPGRATGSGSGLGLALSRRVARSLGGDVTSVSPKTEGAVFVVHLPRARF